MTIKSKLDRRTLLKTSGGALLALPLLQIIGCGASTTEDDSGEDDSGSSSTGSWATGGTAALTADYVDPFAADLGTICAVTEVLTEGPCYSDSPTREDISEGLDGLPVRLCFKVVDADCNPVSGAEVDIWHCDPFGVYSGSDMAAVDFCTGGDPDYYNNDFFRGIQTTDANGLVYFSTCFPGWYSSRAVHIHFIISKGGTSLTSQVGFADSLVNSITANEPVYNDRGTPDTSNSTDTVFPNDYDEFLMNTEQQTDGSMLAWKALVIDV